MPSLRWASLERVPWAVAAGFGISSALAALKNSQEFSKTFLENAEKANIPGFVKQLKDLENLLGEREEAGGLRGRRKRKCHTVQKRWKRVSLLSIFCLTIPRGIAR
jgi:hypothetical protein